MPRKQYRPGDTVEPGIYYRGSRSYQAKVRPKGYPAQSRTFSSVQQARSWRTATLAAIKEGSWTDTSQLESTTVHDLLGRYVAEVVPELGHEGHEEKRQRVQKREANRARALQRRDIAQYSLAHVSQTQVREFIQQRKDEGIKYNAIRLDVAILSRVFKLAKNEWELGLKTDPTEGVNEGGRIKRSARSAASRGRERRLEKDEEHWLLSVASPAVSTLLRFAVATAMRRDEIAELTREDIDLHARTDHLQTTKTSIPRRVPLSRRALGALADSGGLATPGSIWGWSGENIYRRWARTVKSARDAYRQDCQQREAVPRPGFLEDIKFHDLRHEAVSRLFEETALDSLRIAEITGHQSMQMLKRYLHLRDKSRVLAALDEAYGEPGSGG